MVLDGDTISFEPDDYKDKWRNAEDEIVHIIAEYILPNTTCRIDWEICGDEQGGTIIGHGCAYPISYMPVARLADGTTVPLGQIIDQLVGNTDGQPAQ